ncbi:beta strand repeat-containing protein [Haloferula sp.]|uniref:beta strand repeat-containing protein n=1 Tax=Haloferula sp. TaxID=2497595 RepID=UPI00329B5A2E
MKRRNLFLARGAALIAVLAMNANAQLTWDPTLSGGTTGGSGTWDTTATNWWNGASNVAWDNTGDMEALFSTAAVEEKVSIGAGLMVGDVTKSTGQILEFSGSGGDQVLTIKSGGGTWASTGGNAFEFLPSAGLSMTSGDTLTVDSDGGFQAIGASNGDWDVTGATLDYTGPAGNIRGSNSNIGQFETVIMSSESTGRFFADVNNTTLNNDWVLNGTGEIPFDAQAAYNFTLAGDITGSATMRTEFMNNRIVTLNGDNSAWTGGLKVGNASKVAVNNAAELGSGDLTLAGNSSTSAVLLLGGVNLGSDRDLVLSVGGGSIVNQGINSFSGKITGSGGLQIGHGSHDSNTNKFIVSGTDSDHTGNTRIWRGSLELGADDSMSHDTVLQIGGEGNSQFTMAGFDAEIAGLATLANNTRIINNDGADTVLTITTAGVNHSYVGNINGTDGISIVKNGLGTQTFNRNGVFSTTVQDLTVNGGTLVWDADGNTGTTTVGVDGILALGDGQDSGGVGSGAGAGNVGDGNIANEGTVGFDRSDAVAYTGVISGSGGIDVAGGGTVTLDAVQTYTGATVLSSGSLELGVDDALSASTVVTIGGSGITKLLLNGHSQTIAGLINDGNNTRQVANTEDVALGTPAALTFDIANGEEYAYTRAFGDFGDLTTDSGNFSVTKNGLGSQILTLYNVSGATVINEGNLQFGNVEETTQSGGVTVSGGNLSLTGKGLETPSFTVDSGATAAIDFAVLTDWATSAVAHTDYTQLEVAGTLAVNSGASSFTIEIDDANLAGFVESTKSFTIATAATLSAVVGDFDLDVSGFSGTGTWSLAVVSNDVVLTYTATSTPFSTWADMGTMGPVTFDGDTNGDSVADGLAFLLGATNPDDNALGLLPTSSEDGTGGLVMTFTMLDAASRGTATLSVEHSGDLGIVDSWAAALVPDATGIVDGVDFVVSGSGTLSVIATIPVANAIDAKLFGRLLAEE